MKRWRILLIAGSCSLLTPAFGQTNVSADDLLKQAQQETNVNKDYQKAIGFAQQGLQKSPGYTDIRLLLARLYLLTGKPGEARSEYLRVRKTEPGNPDALLALFNVSVVLDQTSDALGYADEIEKKGLDPKILFKKADLLKTANRFSEAGKVAEQLYAEQPGDGSVAYLYKDVAYSAAKFMLARRDTLAAMGQYAQVLEKYPSDTLARNLLLNLQLSRGEYRQAVATIDSGSRYYDNPRPLAVKRKTSLDQYWQQTSQNRVGLSYVNTRFPNTGKPSWRVYSLYYLRKQRFGSIVGRVNYADRALNAGFQAEAEAYPVHGKSYSYVDAAFSRSNVFPRLKLGYSWFTPVGDDYEAELGARYTSSRDTRFVTLTGAISRYLNRYWLSFKPYFTPHDGKVAGSYALTGRYYPNSLPDDYATLTIGYGFTPDDRSRNFEINERLELESLRFTGGYQRTFSSRHIIGAFLTFNRQEYVPGKRRNELEGSLSYQLKF